MRAFRDYRTVSFLILIGTLVVAGCSSSRHTLPSIPGDAGAVSLPPIDHDATTEFDGLPVPAELASGAEAAILTRLSVARQSWDGTPYQFGGTTRDGADCSGFVQQVYREFFGLNLTRATATQVREGREVQPEYLRPGDLVFFRTGASQRHVGIYLYDGQFLHSSSRRGVTIDRLTGGFYERTFWTARRVIPPQMIYQLAASIETQAEDASPEQPVTLATYLDEHVSTSGPSQENAGGRVGW